MDTTGFLPQPPTEKIDGKPKWTALAGMGPGVKPSNTNVEKVGSGATLSEREKKALEDSVPADKLEKLLAEKVGKVASIKPVQKATAEKPELVIRRGMVMRHRLTRRKVTILKTDVDAKKPGEIRHLVYDTKGRCKALVPERNLEPL